MIGYDVGMTPTKENHMTDKTPEEAFVGLHDALTEHRQGQRRQGDRRGEDEAIGTYLGAVKTQREGRGRLIELKQGNPESKRGPITRQIEALETYLAEVEAATERFRKVIADTLAEPLPVGSRVRSTTINASRDTALSGDVSHFVKFLPVWGTIIDFDADLRLPLVRWDEPCGLVEAVEPHEYELLSMEHQLGDGRR